MKKVEAYMQLMRPANIITAIADILMGFAVSGSVIQFTTWNDAVEVINISSLLWLILATIGLYGGGVVYNDILDAELDTVERPERPLPSGEASRGGAIVLGTLLFLSGIFAAARVSVLSAAIAFIIILLALTYNAVSKHHYFFGPVTMGLCRGCNLLLGISAISASVSHLWFMALIPVVYIAAVTSMSRGEVHGSGVKPLYGTLVVYTLVVFATIGLGVLPHYNLQAALPFVLLFCCAIFPSLLNALKYKDPYRIRKAVKSGILSLIILDASISAGFAGLEYGIMVLFLLPLSRYMAKRFSVS